MGVYDKSWQRWRRCLAPRPEGTFSLAEIQWSGGAPVPPRIMGMTKINNVGHGVVIPELSVGGVNTVESRNKFMYFWSKITWPQDDQVKRCITLEASATNLLDRDSRHSMCTNNVQADENKCKSNSHTTKQQGSAKRAKRPKRFNPMPNLNLILGSKFSRQWRRSHGGSGGKCPPSIFWMGAAPSLKKEVSPHSIWKFRSAFFELLKGGKHPPLQKEVVSPPSAPTQFKNFNLHLPPGCEVSLGPENTKL